MPKFPLSAKLNGPDFTQYEIEPRKIISVLQGCHGDIQEYLRHFYNYDQMEALSRTFAVLNKKENNIYRNQWNALVEAYEQAKISLTKRKALEIIAKYEPAEDMDISKYTSYTKLWLGSHHAAESTRAKRLAGLEDAPSDAMERESILQELEEE